MAEQLIRLYGGLSDEAMLTGAETMQQLFEGDVAEFTAFDTDLNDDFNNAWKEAITVARGYPSDETVVDQGQQLTDTVHTTWKACRVHFQDAKYFIEKAFPDNKNKHNEFGFDDYEGMSRYQDKVLGFMDQFHGSAVENSAALIAVGYPMIKINAIVTLATAFKNAQNAQEVAKKKRGTKTQSRVEVMNDVWEFVQQVNKASKSVYRNDYAKLQEYLLPGAGTNEPENLAATGTITDSVSGLPIANVLVELPELSLQSITDNNGKYGFSFGIPPGTYALTGTRAGYADLSGEITIVADELSTKDFTMVAG